MILLAIILVIISALAYSYYQTVRGENELYKLNASRPSLTRSQYIEILTKKGFSEEYIEVVYDEIFNCIRIDDFSMYPEDSIHETYGIDGLDDVELIDNICKKANLRKIEQKDIDNLPDNLSKFTAESILTLMHRIEKERAK